MARMIMPILDLIIESRYIYIDISIREIILILDTFMYPAYVFRKSFLIHFPTLFPYTVGSRRELAQERIVSIELCLSEDLQSNTVITWFSLSIKEILISRRFEQTIVYTFHAKVCI